jgi:hypothetical protein
MAKLCNAASAFFVRNPKGRDGFHPALRYSPLTEARSAARLMPRAGALYLDDSRNKFDYERNIAMNIVSLRDIHFSRLMTFSNSNSQD